MDTPATSRAAEQAPIRAKFEGYTVNDVARYIAGRPENLPPAFEKLTADPRYKNIKNQLDGAWARYEKKHLEPMRKWRAKLDGKASQDVFYPFGGPDATHPVTLFPDARRYTLIGLERFGQVPNPPAAGPAGAATQILSIHNAMRFVLGVNFFRTNSMAVEIGSQPYNGVVSILLLFLARLDQEIVDAYQIAISPTGELVPAEGALKATGVRVIFRATGGGPLREMNFLQVNIADEGIAGSPELTAFLQKRHEITTMLKAASFLMYRQSFDDVRGVILGQSRLILSDDSGMPFHFLNNETWKLTPYGDYHLPIPLFAIRYEPDRRSFFQKQKPEALPFEYGYHPTRYNILLAERAPGAAFATPAFDGGEKFGTYTVYQGGRLVIGGQKPPGGG